MQQHCQFTITMATNSSLNNHSHFKNTLFREIYKNTWLKIISPSGPHKKKEKWVSFCVHDDTEPYVEAYADNKVAVMHKPEWYISLNNIQYISPTICAHDNDYEFVITLRTETVRLAASSHEQMLDWVDSLKRKLYELRILNPKENVYTKLPETSRIAPLLSTRDPTSPLPPPPPEPPHVVPGVDPVNTEAVSVSVSVLEQSSSSSQPQNSSSENAVLYQRSWSYPTNNATARDHPQPESRSCDISESRIFNFENLNNILTNTATTETNNSHSHYEYLYQSQHTPGPSTRTTEFPRPSDCNIRILQQPPHPSKTLREQQVLQLQNEMKHPGGVRLQLRKKDCISSIALVDAFESVWICGWKQKEQPMLHNALHIGDQVVNLEGVKVRSAAEAHQVLQYCGLYVNLTVKRVPHGQVYIIHREVNGQSLGIVQENNTATIESVQADSLAAKHGLTPKARTCDGLGLTNWVLTEINGRPLNLFYKKSQVKDRLNSVGRDISILVQPLDLIRQFKKQLKTLKNYKDYLLD